MSEPVRVLRRCGYCGNGMSPWGSRKYCSEECRFKAWARGADADLCAYCGLPSDATDYIPPLRYRNFIRSLPSLARQYEFSEVPACLECSSQLRDKALWSFDERRKSVKAYLKRRYGKTAWAEWSAEELEDLGYGLRKSVEERLLLMEINRKRINYNGE